MRIKILGVKQRHIRRGKSKAGEERPSSRQKSIFVADTQIIFSDYSYLSNQSVILMRRLKIAHAKQCGLLETRM